MEFEQSSLDELMEFRKVLGPPKAENKTALEAIQEWLADQTGNIVLSPEHQVIFNRWKEVYKMKIDGKTQTQIINHITKFNGVSENTVRNDLKNIAKIFPNNLDVDVEMMITYEQVQLFLQRLQSSSNPKIMNLIPKAIALKLEVLKYLKGDSNLPNPEDFKQNLFIVTADPKSLGIQEELPSLSEMEKRYKSRTSPEDIEFAEQDEQ